MDVAGGRATALAIRGGRIVLAGRDDQALAYAGPRARVEPLDGRVVLPGLVDPHNHLLATGALLGNVALYDCRSIGEVVDRIAARVADSKPGEWVVGRGWDESLLAERRHPTRRDLDPVSPANPVVLHRVWNRLVANSAALAACEISGATPDPPPGLYTGGFERDDDGEPTGLFRDAAKELVLRRVPALREEERVAAIERACRAFNAVGLTGVAEPGLYPYEMDAFARAHEQGLLTVRTDMLAAGWGWAAAASWTTGPPLPEEGLPDRIRALGAGAGTDHELLRVGGVKLLPDGGVGDRTARLVEPYADDSGARGQWVVEPELLREHVRFVHDAGWSLDVHTCGDEAQAVTVEAIAAAQDTSPRPHLRHRVHHAYLPTPDVLKRMARYRIGALVSSPFLAHLGESFVASLGEARAAGIMPMRSYLEAGVPLAGSSDSPITSFDPWQGIQAAVTRRTVTGRVLGEEQRLGVGEAIRSYSADAAAAIGLEGDRGSLEPGKLADCVVLDRDPWTTPPDELAEIRTVATMVGGRWVHDTR
jgi:predicted amidohydrolase YtcJ